MIVRINLTPVGNQCGTCTLCCKVLIIQDLTPEKPKDQWCRHAKKSSGCGVYDMRPESCREYQCVWLKLGLPAHQRPDKIHGVISSTSDGENIVINEDPGWEGHARHELRHMINTFIADMQHYVVVVCGTKRVLIAHPSVLKYVRFGPDDPAQPGVNIIEILRDRREAFHGSETQ